MAPSRSVLFTAVFLLLLLGAVSGSESDCHKQFISGRADFVLNTEASVSEGATFISEALVKSQSECERACCTRGACNVVVVHEQDELMRCFFFDCLYRNQFVCRFVRERGFNSLILDSVYMRHLTGPADSDEEDQPPKAIVGPDIVVRPGTKVILNGSESWDDRKIISYEWKQLRGNETVKTETTDLSDQLVLSNLHSGVYEFELMVTDSSHQSDSTVVTIQVLTEESSELHCVTHKKVGPCRASFPRWYYNITFNKCEEFIFGGCKPNGNNYLSEEECSEACDGTTVIPGSRKINVPVEVCGQPCEEGQFICSNNCCLEGGLECDGQAQCGDGSDEKNCQQLNMTLAQLLNMKVNEAKVRCVEPPATGPCRASMPRWHYDPFDHDCHRFTYGGCRGNKNNFVSKDSCMETCKNITEDDLFVEGLFDRSVNEKPRSGSVATAVILSVVILVLLAMLGYCFLKRKKKAESQRQRVPTSSPPVLPAEDTEQLVYKPTTAP